MSKHFDDVSCQDPVSGFRSLLAEKRKAIDAKMKEVSVLQDDVSTIEKALSVWDRDAGIGAQGHEQDTGDSASIDSLDITCGNATLSDISGCKTQREAIFVIAERNFGELDLKAASDLIQASGMSKATSRTIAGSLHSYVSKSPDWEKIGPSKFRLVKDEAPSHESLLPEADGHTGDFEDS